MRCHSFSALLSIYRRKSPCVNALSFFLGAPVDLPPCILQRPFAIAQFLQGFPVRFDLAPHLFGPRGCFVSTLFLLSLKIKKHSHFSKCLSTAKIVIAPFASNH